MKKGILLVYIVLSNNLFGQSYKEQFAILHKAQDTVGQLSLLKKWETENSKDAELYVAYFNYYITNAKQELVTLGNNPPQNEDVLEIKDSTGKVAGYMYSSVSYNEGYVKKGFEYIDKGISLFPNRLDMRFGKIYVLGEVGNYQEFTEEIVKVIDYSNVNKNAWTWAENKPKPGKEFLLDNIQGYVGQLYNTYDDKYLVNIKQIAETVLKYYPDNVENLSNLSLYYMISKDYDKALESLLKAEKNAPKDYIVLGNIAHCYYEKKDNANAIKYYELEAKYGSEDAKEFANEKLKELRR